MLIIYSADNQIRISLEEMTMFVSPCVFLCVCFERKRQREIKRVLVFELDEIYDQFFNCSINNVLFYFVFFTL